MIRLTAMDNSYADKTVIRFKKDATDDFDSEYDALKLIGDFDEASQIFTLCNELYAIYSILAVKPVEPGFSPIRFMIILSSNDQMDQVILEYCKNGVFQNLMSDSYSFDYEKDETETLKILRICPICRISS
jgi:hypothetical protein